MFPDSPFRILSESLVEKQCVKIAFLLLHFCDGLCSILAVTLKYVKASEQEISTQSSNLCVINATMKYERETILAFLGLQWHK